MSIEVTFMYVKKIRFFRFFGFENGKIFRFSAEKIKSENLEGILITCSGKYLTMDVLCELSWENIRA